MTNNISLEYVASGISHVRFLGVPPEFNGNHIRKTLSMLNTHRDDHSFSILFNAFTERTIGEKLQAYKGSFDKIHADSGGLQMMTRGMQITNNTKQNIYDIQSKYSNVGMCFDEIPIVSSGTVSVSDMKSRYFDHALVKEKATLTGQNLKEQIHRFHDLGTECKPMLILQGNCYESYQEWVDYCCAAIGDDLKYIYGISSAGSSLGVGERENCTRAFFLTHGQYPSELNSKMIHLLGVGSPSKFLPYAALADYFDGCHISYDSTTHTSGMSRGMLFTRNSTIDVPVTASAALEKTVILINEFLRKVGFDEIRAQDILQCFRGAGQYREATGRPNVYFEDYINPMMSIFAYSVSEGMLGAHEVMSHGPLYTHFANKYAGVGAYNEMGKCRDINDFNQFLAKYGRHMKSDKIESSKDRTMSLEEFC